MIVVVVVFAIQCSYIYDFCWNSTHNNNHMEGDGAHLIKLSVFVTIYTNFMEIRELIDPVYRLSHPNLTPPLYPFIYYLVL